MLSGGYTPASYASDPGDSAQPIEILEARPHRSGSQCDNGRVSTSKERSTLPRIPMNDLIERLNAAIRQHYPKTHRHLNPGVDDAAIASAEKRLGRELSPLLRDLYRWRDGGRLSLLPGATFSSLEETVVRYASLREVAAKGDDSDAWHRPSWFPIADSGGATDFFVDLAANAQGRTEQIISWFHEDGGQESGVHLEQVLHRLVVMIEQRSWPAGSPNMGEEAEEEAWRRYGLVRPMDDDELASLAHSGGRVAYFADQAKPTLRLHHPSRKDLTTLVSSNWPKLVTLILDTNDARLNTTQWKKLLDPKKTPALHELVLEQDDEFDDFVELLQGPLAAQVDRLKLYTTEHLRRHSARYYNLANSQYNSRFKKPAKGRELLLELVEITPEDPDVWFVLGNACSGTGDKKAAVKYWLKALDLDPDYRAALYQLGLYEMLNRNDYEKALEYLDRAVAIDGSDVNSRHVQAQAQMLSGDTARARQSFIALIELYEERGDAGSLYQVACVHCVLDNRQESLSWLEKTLRIEPSYAEAAADDRDFDKLKEDPDFLRLTRQSKPLRGGRD